MDTVKISQLPISSEIQGSEILPIVQDSTTKQVAYEDMDNKAYDQTNHSGLGYKRLKKNGGILTQSMINQSNTIYEIRYDFDLNEQNIIIPEKCVLDFKGGSLANGTLIGTNTRINAGLVKIFDTNVEISGIWNINKVFLEWIISNNEEDAKTAFNILFGFVFSNGGRSISFSGRYKISSIVIPSNTSLCCDSVFISTLEQIGGVEEDCIKIMSGSTNIRLNNLYIKGHKYENGIYKNKGIYIEDDLPYNKNVFIDDVLVEYFYYGIWVGVYNPGTKILKSRISFNNNGIMFKGTDCTIDDTYIDNNSLAGLRVESSNNKFSNLKIIFTGYEDPANNPALYVNARRNQFVNIECQDNYGSAFFIDENAQQNTFVNCLSNNDGYGEKDNKGYHPDINATGFYVKGTGNSLSNCIVTMYSSSYGGIYKYPYYISEAAFSDPIDIRVITRVGYPVFNEAIQYRPPQPCINCEAIKINKVGEYFYLNSNPELYINKNYLYNLYIMIEFIIPSLDEMASFPRIFELKGDTENTNKLSLIGFTNSDKSIIYFEGYTQDGFSSNPIDIAVSDLVNITSVPLKILMSLYKTSAGILSLKLEGFYKSPQGYKIVSSTTDISLHLSSEMRIIKVKFGNLTTTDSGKIREFLISNYQLDSNILIPNIGMKNIIKEGDIYLNASTYSEYGQHLQRDITLIPSPIYSAGFPIIDILSKKMVLANTAHFQEYDKEIAGIPRAGTYTNRPLSTSTIPPTNIGFQYYNTGTHKVMYYGGSDIYYYSDGTIALS